MSKSKKIYIVSMRYGTELIEPSIFRTRKEAEKFASDFIYDAARDEYDGNSDNPTKKTLRNWAERNGYELSDYYYWDGCSDASEALISEYEV